MVGIGIKVMTDPTRMYNIFDDTTGRWLATRKNGDLYMKLFRPGCNAYDGGSKLDTAMAKNPGYRAIEIGDNE